MAQGVLERYSTLWQGLLLGGVRPGEPTWLTELRHRGLAIHREHGIPTPRHEEWKYTPLRGLAKLDFAPSRPAELDPSLLESWFYEQGVRLVMVNGRFRRDLSSVPLTPGLEVMSLQEALTADADWLSNRLGRFARIEDHTFAALATSLMEDALVVRVRRGAVIEPLVEVVHFGSGDLEASSPRLLVVVEESAQVRLVETWTTQGEGRTLTLGVTEIEVGAGAQVEHVRVQRESTLATPIHLWEARQDRDSQYLAYNIALGGGVARTDQNIYLAGEGLTTRMDGVVLASGSQLIDNHTRLDHALPNCNSYEIYKQVVDDQATVVFNGKIYVHKDAQKTDAKQTNQALLLSHEATVNSKPQLEIFADDVKCTHGATVGQIEDLPLFYLRTRGLPKAQAEGLLVYAFAAEVLELIERPSVRDGLEKLVFDRFL